MNLIVVKTHYLEALEVTHSFAHLNPMCIHMFAGD